jgi:hypothetical protein
VILLEAFLILIGTNRNLKKSLILICVFSIVAVVYYFGEKVF